jgi:excisionase family DNA binding protein
MKHKHTEPAPQDLTFITSGETAQILGLSRGTVQKLADDQQITGWRTSGGHRRLHRKSVMDYLRKQPLNEPINEDNFAPNTLLITDDPQKLNAQGDGWLPVHGGGKVLITSSLMEGLLLLNLHNIGMLIIDLDRGVKELDLLIQDLTDSCRKQKISLVIAVFSLGPMPHLPSHSDQLRVYHVPEKLSAHHLQALWIGIHMNQPD